MKDKILIIDDNKMLAKLLAKKIASSLKLEVDIVFSFDEAKALLEKGSSTSKETPYLMGFVDLCLPDAPNGEIVDFTLSKGLPSIVLTAMNDEKLREAFMNKDIIDYIFKESQNCVDEMILAVRHLLENQQRKVILAMSKMAEREKIKRILNFKLFNVLVAAHGEEALSYLEDNADTRLIICDAVMPVIDGLGVLEKVRAKYSKTELGVILLNDKNDALECKALKAGANEFIEKPFIKELFNLRLDKTLQDMSDLKMLNNFYDLDALSGLKTRVAFELESKDYLKEISGKNEEFALAFLDIDNLSAINDEYGFDTGDEMIKAAAKAVKNNIKGKDIAGVYDESKFVILLKNISNEKALKVFSLIRVELAQSAVLGGLDELYFTASLGVSFGRSGDDLNALLKKAAQALAQAKESGKNRIEVCY